MYQAIDANTEQVYRRSWFQPEFPSLIAGWESYPIFFDSFLSFYRNRSVDFDERGIAGGGIRLSENARCEEGLGLASLTSFVELLSSREFCFVCI